MLVVSVRMPGCRRRAGLGTRLPVRPQLALPGERGDVGHALRGQLGGDVARVHVHDDDYAQRRALQRRQLAAHERNYVAQLRGALGRDGLHAACAPPALPARQLP